MVDHIRGFGPAEKFVDVSSARTLLFQYYRIYQCVHKEAVNATLFLHECKRHFQTQQPQFLTPFSRLVKLIVNSCTSQIKAKVHVSQFS